MKKILSIAIIVVAASALTGCTQDTGSTAQNSGQKVTEQAFKQQSGAVPYPASQLRDSLERRNLRDRLLRQNKPDALSYVYLLSFGKPLGYYSIKGKVSSTQSQMSTDQLAIECPGQGSGACGLTVNAPGDDGSYGQNEQGIFFFTTEGVMVTTSLDYIVSDSPVAFDVPELNKGK